MTARRRTLLLAGLALLLGLLAAGEVQRREAAVRAQVGPLVPVVVAARDLPAGRRVPAGALALRRAPQRYAPLDRIEDPAELVGQRLRAPVSGGADVVATLVREAQGAKAAPVRRGERVAEVVGLGDPATIGAGTHVDVLVTRGEGDQGSTRVALEDAEVLDAGPVAAPDGGEGAAAGAHVSARLRVTPRQAVYLAAAQSFAREVRLLARSPGDRRRGLSDLAVDDRLGGGR